jgi:hypothetical protein
VQKVASVRGNPETMGRVSEPRLDGSAGRRTDSRARRFDEDGNPAVEQGCGTVVMVMTGREKKVLGMRRLEQE